MSTLLNDPTVLERFIGYAAFGLANIALLVVLIYRSLRMAALLPVLLSSIALAAVVVTQSLSPDVLSPNTLNFVEALWAGSWMAYLIMLYLKQKNRLQEDDYQRNMMAIMAIALALVVGRLLSSSMALLGHSPVLEALMTDSHAAMFYATAVLVLMHNLYKNAQPSEKSDITLVMISMGAMFIMDLNDHMTQIYLDQENTPFSNLRALIGFLTAPLIGYSILRSDKAPVLQLHISQKMVFSTGLLIVIGGYFVMVAMLSTILKQVGGSFSLFATILALLCAGITGISLLASPDFRARIKVEVSKHFFALKYDYRKEWLRFIATISNSTDPDCKLELRSIIAVCNIIQSPGGSLWLPAREGGFVPTVVWNCNDFPPDTYEDVDTPLIKFFCDKRWVANLDNMRAQDPLYGKAAAPSWAEQDSETWLVLPLLHQDALIGFMVINRPAIQISLNFEDYDLLRTVGQQTASYLAEQESQQALVEVKEFDSFNRKFAFIMHDLKNLSSQFALMMKNIDKHRDNPAFIDDVILTVKDGLNRLNGLLSRLQKQDSQPTTPQNGPVDVQEMLQQIVDDKGRTYPALLLNVEEGVDVTVEGDRESLNQAFIHLIQNAIDASSNQTPVMVQLGNAALDQALDHDRPCIVVDIIDEGVGMTAEFIRDSLFKPFQSSKAQGFGIGTCEALEAIKASGGRISVESHPGLGTRFTVRLPALIQSQKQKRQENG